MSWWRPDFPGQDAGIINDDWVIMQIQNLIKEWNDTETQWKELQEYINTYFKTYSENVLTRRFSKYATHADTLGISSFGDIPSNTIVGISNDITSTDISDLPLYGTFATVVKFNPMTTPGFTVGIYRSEKTSWLAFNTGSDLIWTPIINNVHITTQNAANYNINTLDTGFYDVDPSVTSTMLPGLPNEYYGTYFTILSFMRNVSTKATTLIVNNINGRSIGWYNGSTMIWDTHVNMRININTQSDITLADMETGIYEFENNVSSTKFAGLPNEVYGHFATIIVNKNRYRAGFTTYFVIGESFDYIGWNNGSSLKWFNIRTVASTFTPEKAISNINNKKIVICGDSIVAGVGGTGYSPTGRTIATISGEAKKANETGTCWANSLITYLTENYQGVTALNNGISGLNATQLSNNVEQIVPDDTDLCICSIGINDRDYETITQPTNALTSAFANILNRNIELIVIPNMDAYDKDHTYTPQIARNGVITACNNNNIAPVNINNSIYLYLSSKNKTLSELLPDGLHPNDELYGIMFNIITKTLNL